VTRTTADEASWRLGRALWLRGERRTDIARLLGVSPSTLPRRAQTERWADQPLDPDAPTGVDGGTPAQRAFALYNQVADQLETCLAAISAGEAPQDKDDRKQRHDLIMSHQKTLRTVLDYQLLLLKDENRRAAAGPDASPDTSPVAGEAALDLEAARDEIRRRLARLRIAEAG
jgi:hypothetical protein